MSYIIKNNDKSFNLLYPLLGLKRNKTMEENLDSYLYWNCTNESIDDYLILVLYRFNSDDKVFCKYRDDIIIKNNNLSNCYCTSEGELFVFNLFNNKDTVDKFVKGKYSKICKDDKEVIMKFANTPILDKKCSIINDSPLYPMHVVLYPEYYLEDIAKELDVPYSYLYSNGESFNKFNPINETLECEITQKCHINYNQLTLTL